FIETTAKNEKPVITDTGLSEVDREIEKIDGPLSSELQASLFIEKFFDKVRNGQRRDTSFFKANYKNVIKMARYKRYVGLSRLLKLYRGLTATEFKAQNHFLRRIYGIARDIRVEQTISRSVGDQILNDKDDLAFVRRINWLVYGDPLVSLTTH